MREQERGRDGRRENEWERRRRGGVESKNWWFRRDKSPARRFHMRKLAPVILGDIISTMLPK
jgi:hypothetical protein